MIGDEPQRSSLRQPRRVRPPVDDAVSRGLPRLGPRTITTRTRLNQALADVRKAGYAISTDEAAPGVVSIAAPIFDGLAANKLPFVIQGAVLVALFAIVTDMAFAHLETHLRIIPKTAH